MKKLKLNIQYFASTNSTTHYNLSQYIATDKPTYLIDYNQDMSKIDTAIYNAMSKATVNEANIGTMTDLTTTAKTSLVNAINEINTQLGANTTNIGTNTSNIATLGTNMGDLVNLMTVAKNNLVSAINELKGVNDTQNSNIQEVQSEFEKFNLSVFKKYDDSESDFNSNVDIVDVTVGRCIINIARNSAGSIFKIYGRLRFTANSVDGYIRLKNTGINPDSAFTIYAGIITQNTDSNWNEPSNVNVETLYVNADGSIDLKVVAPTGTNRVFILSPCLYFAKNFGDIPE